MPFLVERGEPHLQRLLAIDDALASTDLETECAIARMHVALGEPAVAWRRLERCAPVAAGHRLEGLRLHVAANALRRMGRVAAAREHYQRAITVLEETAQGSELGAALADLGGFHHEQGDQPAARDAWTRALRYVARDGDAHAEAIAVGNLGLLDHESDALEGAERRYRRALALHRATGNRRFEGIVAGDLGELLLASGRPLEACRELARSVEALERVGDDRQWVLISAALSFAETVSGDPETGRARIEAVRERAADDLAPVVALYARAHALHEARLARDAGERAREREILEQLEANVDASGDTPDEMRRAAMVIRAELARHRSASGWVFARDARFFVSPTLGRVELGRRKILRLLVAALLEARLDPDAAPLTQSALLRAGWPGQRAESASARNRLHVSLSTLRKLGLDPLLRGDSAGYFLDPGIAIDFPTGE